MHSIAGEQPCRQKVTILMERKKNNNNNLFGWNSDRNDHFRCILSYFITFIGRNHTNQKLKLHVITFLRWKTLTYALESSHFLSFNYYFVLFYFYAIFFHPSSSNERTNKKSECSFIHIWCVFLFAPFSVRLIVVEKSKESFRSDSKNLKKKEEKVSSKERKKKEKEKNRTKRKE